MSVDCLKNFSLEDVRRARIDFTSSGTTIFGNCAPEFLGERCTVLHPDKNRFGDKSTTGSPISSHRGSSVHHDSSGSSSSGSPIASPASYTRDLIGVDSPGLSGGAGALTPVKKEQVSPMVPRAVVVPPKLLMMQPRAVMLTAEPAPQPATVVPPLIPRKSRFDIKPEDMEVDEKPKVEPPTVTTVLPTSLLPNGKRKRQQSEAKSDSDEGEETIDPRRLGSLGSIVKMIKLETLSSTATTKPADYKPSPLPAALPVVSPLATPEAKPRPSPLVPRAVVSAATRVGPRTPPPVKEDEEEEEEETTQEDDSQDEVDEEEDEESEDEADLPPPFGPQLPKSNGAPKPSPLKPQPLASRNENCSTSSTSSLSSPAAAATTTAATTTMGASAIKNSRKRLLSERGEAELAYPVVEKEIASKWGWEGAGWLNDRKRGQGLINRANDCFLNVILQMITHTAPLARYLVERHKSDCKRESHQCVACALRDNHLARTFRMGQPMETRWIGPHLKRIFPSHSFGMQEDAHELLSLLLDAIDPPPGWNRENGNKELPTNKLKPSTPIEQIFGGTLRNQVTCQSCHTPFINYERIRELNVALGRKQDERIPLANLVQDYFKNETIASFSCKKCARKTQAVRQTRVLRAPAVLIVQLKRFNAYGGKIRQPIAAEKELDLARFTYDSGSTSVDSEAATKRSTSAYVLTGVVEHLGSTVDHGHYIAYCKSIDNLAWFKFDDDEVSRQQTYSSNPYLLFYSRKDLQPKAKNGHINGIAASSLPSTSKLVPPTLNGNGVKQNGGGGPMTNGSNGGHVNGIVKPLTKGGYAPYQNGGMQPKAYGNNNGYSNGNKFLNNGYGNKQFGNNHNQQYNNKWTNNNNNSGRPIKQFQKQYQWHKNQHI